METALREDSPLPAERDATFELRGAVHDTGIGISADKRDGLAVVEALREREKSSGDHLPVIAVTSRSRHEDRDRCVAAGIDAFLPKPVNAHALTSLTSAADVVRRRETR